MISFKESWQILTEEGLGEWQDALTPIIQSRIDPAKNGNINRWMPALENLESISAHINKPAVQLDQDTVSVCGLTDNGLQSELHQRLKTLMPWRKGPFHLHGIDIDTEWRSDWKWQRVIPHLNSLEDKTILDVGCGSGYHLWRMRGAGAKLVVGIDPSALFLMQFRMMQHFINDSKVQYLPVAMEEITPLLPAFDLVFSMGVVYHRRSPIDHIMQLKACLKPGGQLVLETLVINSSTQNVLIPDERYAKMRNVWFLPSPELLKQWVIRCGFTQVKIVDIDQTSLNEQRRTDWMQFESLQDFLDPDNPDLTIEGYPAPVRAVLTATLPV